MSESKQFTSSTGDDDSDDEERTEYEIDPELDIRSEYFNPIKALYAPEIHMSLPNAKLYDNVAQYEAAMKIQGTSRSSVSSLRENIYVHLL